MPRMQRGNIGRSSSRRSNRDEQESIAKSGITTVPDGFRPSLLAATAFLGLELLVATVAGLSLWPFLLCALGFSFLILRLAYTSRHSYGGMAVKGRILSLALLVKVMAVCVAVTGGFMSPFKDVLFIPVFLGALYFGLRGSMGTAAAVLAFFAGLWYCGQGTDIPAMIAIVQAVTLLLVAFVAGWFAQQLNQTAAVASDRARLQERRATEVEWFTDTAVMMQSLYDLEHMLSVGLLRLGDLIHCDTVAIFLRDGDEGQMVLAQTLGLRDHEVGLRVISIADQAIINGVELEALLWPDIHVARGAGAFARLDPQARSLMVAPLRTLDDVFGIILIASRRPNVFSEQDRARLVTFAQHIVYPVQRVRLQAMATTDTLTGLYNRRAFHKRLREEIERVHRYGTALSLVLLDIDYFKRANDTYGHQAGDAILAQIGALLRRVLRGIDFPVRYGGEELAVLCPQTVAEDARTLAERIRATVEGMKFDLPEGGTARITVSIGVATIPTHAGDEETLLEHADTALYAAKAAGRNRVCIARQEREEALRR